RVLFRSCTSALKNFTHGGLGHTKSLPSFFPSFSLFSLFFPLFSSSPLFPLFPPHGVRVCPSFGAESDSWAHIRQIDLYWVRPQMTIPSFIPRADLLGRGGA